MVNAVEIESFSHDVEKIYKSSLNPDNWPYALESLCASLEASKAQLLYINSEDLTFSFASGYGFDPYEYDIGASRFRRYLTQDPVALYALDHPNKAFSDSLAISNKEKSASAMQTDIRDPADMEHLLTIYLTDTRYDGVALILFRGKNQPSFTEEDVKKFELYIPHIQNATQLHKSFSYNNQVQSLQSAVLNSLSYGVLVTDEDRNIIVCNTTAQQQLEKSATLSIRNRKLTSLTKTIQKRLNEGIRSAANCSLKETEQRQFAVKLTDSLKEQQIIAVISSLNNQDFDEKQQYLPLRGQHYTSRLPNRKFVMLSLCSPDRILANWPSMLNNFFSLTPAEANLAARLLQNCSLQKAAQQLGRSVGTARVQLHSIFEKTDTSSQSELIKLLMTLQH